MWKAEDDELLEDEDEDEENVERAEEFEYKYNFRYEEEGGDQVSLHACTPHACQHAFPTRP